MKSLILIFHLISFYSIFGQIIDITIIGSNEPSAALFYIEGEKTIFVDSIKAKGEGKYLFQLDPLENHIGLYRFRISNTKWIDFIYDAKGLVLKTKIENILEDIQVTNSESNWLFYKYVKLTKDFKAKTDLLQLMLARYPQNDDYYIVTRDKLERIQKSYQEFTNNISQSDPSSFISRYIKSSQLPVVDGTLPIEEQLKYLKTHALDYTDFNDAELIYSDVFTNKSIEYLSYFRNQQLPKELLEKEFIEAVDSLLLKARVNRLVYQRISEYLIDGFKKFGFDEIVDYIIENYVIKDDLCLDEKLESSIERRINQSKLYKIGTEVPEILLPDSSGRVVAFNEIDTEKILILFYASWCSHCKELLPELYKIYSSQKVKKIEVFAISLDTERTDWIEFINTYNLKWINVSDLKGWNGEAAIDFHIYATPTMFLLDNERKILAKPIVIEDVMKWFKENKIDSIEEKE
jgi:peroxiredoxin